MIFRLFLAFLTLSISAAFAAEADKDTPLTRLDAASKKMMQSFSHNEALQFEAIRNAHGIIRAVEDVGKNIDAASKSCSERNPEFANTMRKRVGEWKAGVDPILEDARAKLDTMIKLQDFAKPAEARAYLQKVDAAVAYKARKVENIPVTEKRKCKKLLGAMDDRQDDLKKLLIENLELNRPVETAPER